MHIHFEPFRALREHALDRLAAHEGGLLFIAESCIDDSRAAAAPVRSALTDAWEARMDGAHITGIDGIQVVIIGGPGHAGEDHGYGRLLFLSTDFSSTGFRSLVLEAVMKILKWRARPISVFSGNYIYLITPDEVRYVESDRRTLHIHASSLIDTYATITQFRELVPSHFIQCHKSYLVNIDFIKAFTGDRIILLTGESVPVSQRRKHAVREQILRFSKGL